MQNIKIACKMLIEYINIKENLIFLLIFRKIIIKKFIRFNLLHPQI